MNALLTFRSLPALLYFLLLGTVLTLTLGIYQAWGVFAVCAGFVFFTLTLWAACAQKGQPLPVRASVLLLLLSLMIFSGLITAKPNILYPQLQLIYFYFQISLKISGLILGLFVFFQLIRTLGEKSSLQWLIFLLAIFFYLRLLVLSVSPNPFIDVFTSGSLGADYFLGGLNPYTQSYPDIYAGDVNIYGDKFNYNSGFFYGPVYLYLITPFRLLHDIRLASIAADFLTVAAIWRIGSLLQWNTITRTILILLWLLFPVSLFVLEQSWIDPLLVAALAWTFCFLIQNKFTALGIALGVFCGIKHYGVVPAAFILLHVVQRSGFKPALKTAGWAAALLLVTHLPFLILDADSLIKNIWTNVLETPPRRDALTLWAWTWNSLGIVPVKSTTLAISGFLICLILRKSWKSEPTLSNLTRGMVLAMSVLFLLGYQAFCNYYYFLAFLVFLDLIFSLAPAGENEEALKATPAST